MLWLSDNKNVDNLSRFDTISDLDGQTDTSQQNVSRG